MYGRTCAPLITPSRYYDRSIAVRFCLSVCPFAYLRNDTPERHQIFLVDVLFWRIVVIDVFPVFWMTSVKRHNTE